MKFPFTRFSVRIGRRLTLLMMLLLPLWGWGQSTTLVISQVYTTSGGTGAAYRNDYVEIFNKGTTSISLSNYSIAYFSAAGGAGGSVSLTSSASIPAGGYYLLQLQGGANGAALSPNQSSSAFNMSSAGGRVDLLLSSTVIDRVGYGTATTSEGSNAAAAPSLTNALFRAGSGCTDTDNNGADFTSLAAAPRNASTPPSPCTPAAAINTPTFATTPVCASSAASLDVTFTASGTFNAANVFTVQLSNAAGSFTSPVAIATLNNNLTTAQTVTTTIPAGTASGTGYRIRVVASNPATTSAGTSAALTIVSNPAVSIAPTATQTYVAGNSGSPLTATETPAAATNTRVWQVGSTATGPFTALSPAQTGLTYTPTFATAGTYFVRVLSTFAACADVASNVVEIDVTAPPANTINTPTFATTPVCASAAASLDVTFTASGPYDPANVFTVQLSDASGSFAAPVTIATLSNNLTTAQTVTTTIPAGTASGTGYRIRVVASNPTTTSAGTSAALTIVSNPAVSIAPTATQTIAAGANGTALTATETAVAGTTRVWQVGSAATGPFTTIAGQTAPTYTPTFATAGTYFVRALSTFAGCGNVASNVVEIDVTNAVPTLSSLSPATAVVGGAGFTLTVNGTGFVSGAVVSFNSAALPTTFVNATQLTASVPASAIAATGSFPVTVTNPAPTAGASPALTFTVTEPILALYDFTGALATSGAATTVAANFVAGSFSRTGIGNAGSTNIYSSNSFATSSTGFNAGNYVAVTVNPAATYVATLQALAFDISRSNTGPSSLELRSSLDNYATNIGGVQTVFTTNTTLNFTLGAAFANLSSTAPVTFRIYGYGATNSGGTQRLDNVLLYGSVAPAPAVPEIDVTANSASIASGGSYTYAASAVGATADATFTIANTGTGALNISNVALSNNAGGAFSIQTSPLPTTVAAAGSTPLVVRFAPTTPGNQTATLTITNNDSDEGSYTITLNGSTLPAAEPTVQPTVTATAPTISTVLLTLSGGDGAKRLVVVRPTASAAVAPLDGTTYTANAAYGTTTGSNPTTGANNFVVVADGSTTSLTITGLSAITNYSVAAYAYNDNGIAGLENYLAPAPGTATFTTLPPLAGAAQAGVLLLEDDFNGPAGTRLTANGWTAHSGAGTNGPMEIQAASLSYAEYPAGLPTSNNQATAFGSGEDVNRGFAAPAGTTTLYAAAVVKIGIDDNDYFLHLMDTNAPNTAVVFRAKLFTKTDASGSFKFGLSVSNSSTAAATYSSALYNAGQSYLVVLKYVTNAGGNDEASLYVFDAAAPAIEPATPTIGPLTETNTIATNSLNALALRQSGTTPVYYIDGIRVATGWGSAVGKPVFTGPAATLATGNYYDVAVNNGDQVTAAGAVRIENSLSLTSGLLNTTSANSVALYASATIAGGGATSFVNGPLSRTTAPGAASTLFPVGKGAAYRPLTLTATAQTSTTTYTAEVLNTSARTTGFDAPLTRVSNIRYATITPDAQPSGFSGTLTMAFGADDYVTDPQNSTLVMAKRDGGGNWQSIGRSSATGSASGGNVSGTLTSDVFTSFSDFALASTDAGAGNLLANNPLPVELTAFTAQRQADKSVVVRWITASEKNSAYFDVQRSLNGHDFTTLSTTTAQGSSSNATSYVGADATAPAAQLYYRLRQVDADGTVAYSPVAKVAAIAAVAGSVMLYPNPAHSRISFQAEVATAYRVLNQVGQALVRGTTAAGTAHVLIEQLPAGLYFLELQTAVGRTVQKFEKE